MLLEWAFSTSKGSIPTKEPLALDPFTSRRANAKFQKEEWLHLLAVGPCLFLSLRLLPEEPYLFGLQQYLIGRESNCLNRYPLQVSQHR